jgi:hypothetical protein
VPSKSADRADDERGGGSSGLTGPGRAGDLRITAGGSDALPFLPQVSLTSSQIRKSAIQLLPFSGQGEPYSCINKMAIWV